MNRKFTHCLQKIGHDLAQAKAQEVKPSIAFMLMDNLGYGELLVIRNSALWVFKYGREEAQEAQCHY